MNRETMRARAVARPAAVRAGTAFLLALLVGSLACSGGSETRRPLPTEEPPELVEKSGVTRPSFTVGRELESDVSDAPRGRLVTALAIRGVEPGGEGGARARLALRGADPLSRLLGRDPGACEVSWDGPADARAWQPCEIPVRHGGRLRLSVRLDGPPGAELLLAAPVLEAAAAREALPPVFVIVLDTARADAWRSFDPRSAIGTHLEALARDGITFPRARSPSAWTRTAIATLFTGRSPFAHQVLDRLDALAPDATTLPGLLQQAGYVTLAWSTNPNVLPRWGFARGFDVFEDVGTRVYALAKPDGHEVIDRVEAALEHSGAGGRFFYLHLMDPHHPYQPEAASLAHLDRITNGDYPLPGEAPYPGRTKAVRGQLRRYLAELHENDEQVGRLVALLRARGEYERALIAVLSDHGEEFLDHGGTGHGQTLYEEMLRVPLWLKLPHGRRAGTRIDAEVGLADLHATILAALGLPAPQDGEGRDLLAGDLEPAPHLARLELEGVDKGAVVHEGWKLILDVGSGRDALYHLDEDPTEQNDLVAAHPERAAALRALFEQRRFEHQRGWHVRGCGGPQGGRLAFQLVVEGDTFDLGVRAFEADDRLRRGASGAEVSMELPVREITHARPFARRQETARDEDELVVASAAGTRTGDAPPIEVRATAGGSLAWALGAGAGIERGAAIRPGERREAALVSAGRSVRCAEAALPYLQIWLVEAASEPSQEVDPELRERLRALGYGL